jgi:CubicO group peptidase (beta-lactamase class C family)
MKFKHIIPVFLAFFFLAGYSNCIAQQNNSIINQRLDSLIGRAVSMNLFSGDVLVVDNNKIIYDKAFGKADYEKNIPNTLLTQFQIGSITKQFTKVMILQLIEQKKLSFTDTIGKFFTGFSSQVSAVTVKQLLDHKSGLGSYTDGPPFGEDRDAVENIKTISDILPYIKKEKLHFKPGTQALYSNSGYVTLAAIIEKVSGKNYYEMLKGNILDKMKMAHTGFSAYVKPTADKATGYLSNSLGPLQSNAQMHIIGGGDGGIFMTTHDLLAFSNSLLYDNKLLSNSSKEIAFANPFNPATDKTWDEFQKTGKMALAGGAPGISALWSLNMFTKKIVIVFSNYDEGTAEQLGMRIGGILNNTPAPPLHPPSAKYLYDVINTKGGKYFEDNYKAEIKNSGMQPNDDMVLLSVGRQYLEHNSPENAISLYKVYTISFPQIIVAWNDLGDAYLQKNDKDNAKKCYEQALTIRPDNPRAKRALEKLK